MIRKKTVDAETLRAFSSQELLNEINTNELSLLKTLGADDLLNEMMGTGNFCQGLIDIVCLEKDDGKLREAMCRAINSVAPTTFFNDMPQDENCIVIGFNHPSLGEILRLGYIVLKNYPGRDILFPVNIPWYETLTAEIPNLERLNVHITPMITPKTEAKLIQKAGDDQEMLNDIQHYKTVFEKNYMRAARKCAENNGIIVVAPSATRQKDVFVNEEQKKGEGHLHPTMTLLARVVLRKESDRATFLPMAVLEPPVSNPNLNLFRDYRLYPCEPFSTEDVRNLTSEHSRKFDYEFLKRIDNVYRHKTSLQAVRKK